MGRLFVPVLEARKEVVEYLVADGGFSPAEAEKLTSSKVFCDFLSKKQREDGTIHLNAAINVAVQQLSIEEIDGRAG